MSDPSPSLSVLIFSLNGFNSPIKRKLLIEWVFKNVPTTYMYRDTLESKYKGFRSKRMGKDKPWK